MTCAFTRRFGTVYACDLDAGFLERCREAVARFGKVDRLRTIEVADGRTLAVPDDAADVVFSYITLQHCERDDALALVDEALRVVRPGRADRPQLPLLVGRRPGRAAGRRRRSAGCSALPGVGSWLSHRRMPTRLAWQANRLDPHQVVGPIADRITDVVIWRNPARDAPLWGVERRHARRTSRASTATTGGSWPASTQPFCPWNRPGRRTASSLASPAMRVGVVGATGQVGGVMRRLLAERGFPVDEIRFFASARSAGTTLPWGDGDDHRRGRRDRRPAGLDIALFSAGATSSRELAPRSPPPARS